MTETGVWRSGGSGASTQKAAEVTPEQAKAALDKMILQPFLNNAIKNMNKNATAMKEILSGKGNK